MSCIELRHIYKYYQDQAAISDLSLQIDTNDFIVVLGPSGCGKSTTLRMIAGLEDISSGELWIGDKLVNDVEPKDRDIAMVFQNYALYPHLTVKQNIIFPLENLKGKNKLTKREMSDMAYEVSKLVQIEELLVSSCDDTISVTIS